MNDQGQQLDELVDKLLRPIEAAYSRIELELLIDIANRLNTYDEVGGLLGWRIERLNELGAINLQTAQTIAKLSGQTLEQVQTAIETVVGSVMDFKLYDKAYKAGMILIDPRNIALQRVLQPRYNEAEDMVELIQSVMINSHKQEYLHIVDKVYIEAQAGIKSPPEAIKDAIMDLAEKGISGATYKRKNGSTYNMAIEPVVRRNVITTLVQSANKVQNTYVEELGVKQIYVSQHIGARDRGTDYKNHELWQGKVYDIEEFVEKTGYGEMMGLGGINCRHSHFPYFKGISPPIPPKINTKENNRVYNLTQKQRKMERDIRKTKKTREVARTLEDNELIIKQELKLKKQFKEINELVRNNPELRRDFTREQIQ